MASDNESPGSPLSSIASEEFTGGEEDDLPPQSRSRDDTISVDSPAASTPVNSAMHPSKRRRIERAVGTPLSVATVPDGDDTMTFDRPTSPAGSISSDSSGDIPNSPSSSHFAAGLKDDDDGGIGGGPQITVCKWTDCTAGDLRNMDELVKHLHNIHMPHRQKKYSCEWQDCTRKGQAQASGYALRAHMRSHTREKPFYCALPECDRSFTRSDALAKHMRTVHETEALRPSDPIPKNHTGGPLGAGVGGNGNLKRIKLVFGQKEKGSRPGLGESELPPLPALRTVNGSSITTNGHTTDLETDIDSLPFELPIPSDYYTAELQASCSDHELSLPPSQLYQTLRQQLHWATQENQQLNEQLLELQEHTEDLVDGITILSATSATNNLVERNGDSTREKSAPHATTTPGGGGLSSSSSSSSAEDKFAAIRKAAWRGTEKILDDILAGAVFLQEQTNREIKEMKAAAAAAAAEAADETDAEVEAEAPAVAEDEDAKLDLDHNTAAAATATIEEETPVKIETAGPMAVDEL